MLTFKNKTSGLVVEVTEEFANQVLRPQGKYEEIFPEEEIEAPKVEPKRKKKVAKKKAKRSS